MRFFCVLAASSLHSRLAHAITNVHSQPDLEAAHAAQGAALAANQAAESAALATNVAEHSATMVHDAVSALRLTESALRGTGGKHSMRDADEMARIASQLEADQGKISDGEGKEVHEDIRQLRARLDTLERRYETKQTRAHSTSRQRELEQIRGGIASAENDLDRYSGDRPIAIDSTIVPFPGAVENFGGEDTAKELTASSQKESDSMIDSIENAQSMEGKRAVYRALTHLRGTTITAYDGIARSHIANVDHYGATHKWRDLHRVHHLAEEEGDVDRWAFPARKAPRVDVDVQEPVPESNVQEPVSESNETSSNSTNSSASNVTN